MAKSVNYHALIMLSKNFSRILGICVVVKMISSLIVRSGNTKYMFSFIIRFKNWKTESIRTKIKFNFFN